MTRACSPGTGAVIVNRILIASLLALASGCAGRSGAATTTPEAVAAEAAGPTEADLEAMRTQREEQEREIRRLEAQLALARAEQERARHAEARTETVRIGDDLGGSPHDDLFADEPTWGSEGEVSAMASEPDAESPPSGPRPVLRLYGSPAAAPLDDLGPPVTGSAGMPPAAPVIVPVAPPGVSMHLPVSAIPPSPSALPPLAGAGALPIETVAPAEADPAVAEYRRALGLVRDGRLPAALAALRAFSSAHRAHPYALNAAYWEAEVLYMQRRYAEAQRLFEAVVARDPRGSKVPDALLKIGMCHQRMGDGDRARAFFQRVRTEFPNSVAARTVSREDAS